MNPTLQQFIDTVNDFMSKTEDRLRPLEEFNDNIQNSGDLTRLLETAIRSRLSDIVTSSFIIGIGTFSGGHFDITDGRITSTSIGVATRANSSGAFAGRDDLAAGYLSGTTFRFFEGSFSETYQIFYIIKP